MVIDRRINRDTDFFYVKSYDNPDRAYRAQKLNHYVGLLPGHDAFAFSDFNKDLYNALSTMIVNMEPLKPNWLLVEASNCPDSHQDIDRHTCSFCMRLRHPEDDESNVYPMIIKVHRYIYRWAWTDPKPPVNPGADNDQEDCSRSPVSNGKSTGPRKG